MRHRTENLSLPCADGSEGQKETIELNSETGETHQIILPTCANDGRSLSASGFTVESKNLTSPGFNTAEALNSHSSISILLMHSAAAGLPPRPVQPVH